MLVKLVKLAEPVVDLDVQLKIWKLVKLVLLIELFKLVELVELVMIVVIVKLVNLVQQVELIIELQSLKWGALLDLVLRCLLLLALLPIMALMMESIPV